MTAADLVMFGEDWGRHPTSTQALAAELSRDRRVLWVDSVGLRRPRLSDAGRALTKVMAGFDQCRSRRKTAPIRIAGAGPVAVVSPLAVPFPGASLARRANVLLWRRTVARRAAQLDLDRPILWVSLPTAIDARFAIEHRAMVYYCGDDFSALDGVDHAPVAALERELARVADLIVVSHQRLADRFPPERTLLLPHGVSVSRFATIPDTRPSGPPTAGYLGLIDERTDFTALEAAARGLPCWPFALCGPVAPAATRAVARLETLNNVVVTGRIDPVDVPALLKRWTAALLPYRDTPMTRACDPLKMREYLAAGLPVAAFPFARGLPHSALLDICAPDALARTLTALAQQTPAQRKARRAAMASEDWSARAALLSDALERLG